MCGQRLLRLGARPNCGIGVGERGEDRVTLGEQRDAGPRAGQRSQLAAGFRYVRRRHDLVVVFAIVFLMVTKPLL